MPIDELVNQNILTLRLVERVLHDRSGWILAVGREVADARIEVADTSITMRASFEHTDPDVGAVSIYHHGELVWERPVVHVGGNWDLEWTWHIEHQTVSAL